MGEKGLAGLLDRKSAVVGLPKGPCTSRHKAVNSTEEKKK